jgi:ABC-type spermidine/putrescine transport system permease subunit I
MTRQLDGSDGPELLQSMPMAVAKFIYISWMVLPIKTVMNKLRFDLVECSCSNPTASTFNKIMPQKVHMVG